MTLLSGLNFHLLGVAQKIGHCLDAWLEQGAKMKFSDRLMGIILILFSLAILYEIRDFPVVPGQDFGSDLLPRIIALGLIAGGLSLLITDLRKADRDPLLKVGDWVQHNSRILMVLAIILGTASFIPFVDFIGFPLLSAGLILLMFLLSRVKISFALPMSVVAAFAIHTIFAKLFLVPLPWGLLDPIAW